MKRGIIIFIALIFLSMPFALAVEFDVNANFSQGETLLAKLSGNFLSPITKDNIFFYRGHDRIPMEFDLTKINGDYYIYALLADKAPNNYSISVENVKYMEGAQTSLDNIVKNFIITNQTADFSVKPGFITDTGDFSLEVQNLQDNSINIDVITSSSAPPDERGISILPDMSKETSFSLESGQVKEIDFNVGDGNSTFQTIELTTSQTTSTSTSCFFIFGNCSSNSTTTGLTYEIPVYLSASIIPQGESFGFEPSELFLSLPTNNITNESVILFNNQNQELDNISLSLSSPISSFATLPSPQIASIGPNSNISVELSLFSTTSTNVSGNLIAQTINSNTSLPITLNFISNYVPPPQNQSASLETCAQLNGSVCDTTTQQCSNQTVYATDNVCCLGTCQPIQTNNTGTIIAIVIISLVIIGILWFYFSRYRKQRRMVNLLKIAKKEHVKF
jgi:hypothetical protein